MFVSFLLQLPLEMIKPLADSNVVQNENHTMVFPFNLCSKDFIKRTAFFFLKMKQNTDNVEDNKVMRINMKQSLNHTL